MTRKLLRFILPVALLTMTALAQTGVAAAAPAGAAPNTVAPSAATGRIGIISIQNAIFMTNEGRRDLETLQAKFEPKQKELNAANQDIENLQKQLQTQGDKLNEQARNELARNIDAKKKSFQRNYEDAQSDFQNQQNDILNRVGGKVMEVLDKYAKQNGYSMILDVSNPQSPVLWAAQTTDLTQEIVTAYNAQSGVPAPTSSAPAQRPPSNSKQIGPSSSKPAAPRTTAPPAQKPPR
ncbi:MAG: OmpH family outer membrane protein [Terriglobales bacterium]